MRLQPITAALLLGVVFGLTTGCEQSQTPTKSTAKTTAKKAEKSDASKATAAAPDKAKPAAAKPTAAESVAPKPPGGVAKTPGSPEIPADPKPKETAGKTAAGRVAPAATQVEPAELIMPKVLLTQAETDLCPLKVSDAMPAIDLPDLAGDKKSLASLLGRKLTVVLFWSARHPYAVEELADLGPDVATPFAEQGVNVVAINEHDSAEAARQVVERVGAPFPNLRDADGAAFSQVAARKLPRTFLLGGDGKILWFDLEYSRSTRRDLQRAIRFTLHENR